MFKKLKEYMTEIHKTGAKLFVQLTAGFGRSFAITESLEFLLKNKVNRTMNISEIAYEVGFNDPKYFTRCFTKHFNVTPSSLLVD